jgi:hypothetical protein
VPVIVGGKPAPMLGMVVCSSVGCCVLILADCSILGIVYYGCSFVVVALPTMSV